MRNTSSFNYARAFIITVGEHLYDTMPTLVKLHTRATKNSRCRHSI